MINPTFYNSTNTVYAYFGGKVLHYPVRPKVTVVGTYKYTLTFGENMYTLASELFGKEREHFWTILAEINDLREPDDWVAQEVVNLPKVIVTESKETKTEYTNVKTDSTTISITS